MGERVMKSVFVTFVLVTLGLSVVLAVEPPCPRPAARCPRTWNYQNAQQWGSLCQDWSTCSKGQAQSPIDVFPPAAAISSTKRFDIKYQPQTNVYVFNTGKKFIFPVNQTNRSTFDYNGVTYFLRSVEFHAPSEHLLRGKRYNLEMQLTHKAGNGRLLVVSIFFDVGDCGAASNSFLEQIQFNLPQFSGAMCGNGRVENLAGYFSEECDNGVRNSNDSASPNCCRNDCTLARCGDGVKDTTEQCDNGRNNSNTPGACRTNCRLPACGDGILDPNEQCDDGNVLNGDGCTSICRKECGDGQLNFVEQCDNGTLNSDTLPDSCRTNCRFASCGDSVVDSKEECDFGSLSHGNNPSQCRASCKAPRCGDGFTDLNEDCDDGDGINGVNGPCSANCTLNCGNGKIETGEECDDGAFNSNAPNGRCRTNCKLRSCGDGIIDTEYDEQCDSAFGVNNTWCSDKCIQRCGNGIIEAGEECDNGCTNSDTPDAPCRTNCKLPVCGDGIVDRGEDCDLGPLNSLAPNSACRPGCKAQRCGDGVADLDKGEECDNGRNNLGSGCNMCRTECGNGNLDAGEECDFGEKNSDSAPDGCRKSCRLARCGDGILDSREECDAGSANSDSAPNACRTSCRFNYCGDGVIDPQNGEQCDNGAANSDTAVDGCSSDCILNQFRQSRVLGTTIVDLNKALPRSHSAVAYHGSLAAPPCTEGVQWLLFQEVQAITKFQYDLFTAAPYGIINNTRPVQKVCTRTVTRPFDVPVPSCGNGIQEVGEQCDNGLRNSDAEANACRTNCREATCGDGVTDAGEECDDVLATSRCTALCRFPKPLSNPFTCPVWSYKDACKWSLLCPQWNLCNSERANSQQSPINLDISPKLGRGKFNLDFSYSQTSITSVNSGRGVALLNSNANNVLRVPGDTRLYSLKFIRFHSPSEHAINGKHADLEAQFHHVTADGSATAVVSVLFNKGPRNGFLDQFWFYLSRDSDCRFGNNVINPSLGEQCDNGWKNSDTRPDQCRSNGRLPSCGDGVVDRGEQCDDGANNRDDANSCKPDCRLPFCGDGFVDAGEACDWLFDPTCTRTCTRLCGNGIKETGEDCDNGPENSNTPNACRTDCKSPVCGDSIVDANEECDSDFACHGCLKAKCGDGFIDDGEECDDGNGNGDTAPCSPICQLNCGNGRVDPLEQCDDGMNNSNSDGACRTDCSVPSCGDFITDKSRGEQCDDGPRGSIFCSTNCTILCGNGIVEDGEACDDGAGNSDTLPNACRTNCQNPFCGDGVRDKQEECDFGSQNGAPNSPCRLTCKLPRFGDDVVDAGEECDDGNLDNGDGCSSTGLWECGNGRRDGPQEECDNGAENADKPNACRTRTWKYGGCVKPTCGDGIVDDGEQCDDGFDGNSDDLPNHCRTNCKLPTRGDTVVDDLYGERCDNGAHNHDFLDECSGSNVLNECRTSTATAGQVVDLQNAFDRTSPVLTYKGSSSQPPCEEGWTYFVLSKISTVDQLQLDSLRKISPPGNVRGLQPLNGRVPVYTATQDAVCGDGVMEKDEECDAGDHNANQPNKCRTNCKKPSCGDGILDAGEQCDNGRLGNSAKGPCGTNCRWTGTPATAGCTQNGSNTCATSPTTTINVIFANLLKGAQCSTGSCPNQQ